MLCTFQCDIGVKQTFCTLILDINCWIFIVGGTCAAWYGDKEKRSPLSADLFGSVCYTIQHGSFRKYYGDLTRLDARLDICSASALAKRVLNGFKSSSSNNTDDPTSHPRLNLIFQQQVFRFMSYILVSLVFVQDYADDKVTFPLR